MKSQNIAALAVALVLCSLSAFAQDDRAAITGTITDASHAAIAGATVVVNSRSTGSHREVETNDAGVYSIPGLLIGVYEVNILKTGFRTEEFKALELVVGQVRTINAQMQVASSSQQVQVEGETPALTQNAATVGGVIGSTQVADLPINGPRLDQLDGACSGCDRQWRRYAEVHPLCWARGG